MEKEKKQKILPIIIVAIVIILIIAITLGVVYGTKPKDNGTDKDKDTTENNDTTEDNVVWGDWEITIPSNDDTGIVVRVNDKGEKEEHVLPELSSDKYTRDILVAPTYDADGKTKYTITIDGVTHSFDIVTPKAQGNVYVYVNGTKLDTAISHLKADTVTIAMLEALIGENYTAYAIYSDEAYANAIEDIDAYTKDKAETNIYVKKTLTYTLTLNDGIIDPTESTSIKTNEPIALPIPIKTGYDFAGWYATETFDAGTMVSDTKAYYSDTNITLYAKWTKSMVLYDPIYEIPEDDTSEIVAYSVKANPDHEKVGALTIPSSYNGKPVTEIQERGFFTCTGIDSITLPDSLVTIWASAFVGCNGLRTIAIPDSVVTISSTAFTECHNLESVTFGANSKLATIDSSAFKNCTSLRELILPNKLKTIEMSAFANCSALGAVVMPGSIETVRGYLFDGCNNVVVYITSPSVPSNWMEGWDYTREDQIPADRIILGYDGESHTYNFEPDGGNANSSESLDKTMSTFAIKLPTPTKTGCTFNGWYESSDRLGTKHDGGTMYYNNKGATLYAAWTLPTLAYESDGADGYIVKANPTNKPTDKLVIPATYNGKKVTQIKNDGFSNTGITSVTIPNSVTTLGVSAFFGCAGLETVEFEKGSQIKDIDEGAFANSGIKSITIPNSVTTINILAFDSCASLKSVTFEPTSKLTAIYDQAFKGCTNVSSIIIPSSITDIYSSAFEGWTSSQTIYVNRAKEGMTTLAMDWNGKANVVWNYDGKSHTYNFVTADSEVVSALPINAMSTKEAITLPAPANTVEHYFYGWFLKDDLSGPMYTAGTTFYANADTTFYAMWKPSLLFKQIENGTAYEVRLASYCEAKEITIPDTYNGKPVKKIANGGFKKALTTKVTLGKNIEVIGDNAFEYSQLAAIDIPSDGKLTTLGNSCFSGADKLTVLHLPHTIRSIGSNFVSILQHLYYDGTMSEWNSIPGANDVAAILIHCKDGEIDKTHELIPA